MSTTKANFVSQTSAVLEGTTVGAAGAVVALSPEAARNHADRHLILRALGCRSTVEVATWDQPLPVRPGDSFVLCSDGLHNAVSDEEIRVAVESQEAPAACEALVAVARERGGHDNITVAIARVED